MDLTTAVTYLLVLVAVASVTGIIVVRSPRDPVTLLTVMLCTLFLLSARLVVAPMGKIGTPAIIIGLVAFGWWFAAVMVPSLGLARGPQPARWIVLGYAWFMGIGYVIAHGRPLTPLELSGSDRGMIQLISLCGIALLAADGIRTRERLDALLRRLVWLAGVFAAFGVIQFLTGFDIVAHISVPGLSQNLHLAGIGSRSGFGRPASTALHAIEFSVALCMVLPLAAHYALFDKTLRGRRIAMLCVALIGTGIPMSVSRTGVLGVAVAFAFMLAGWSWQRRLRGLVTAGAFSVFLYLLIPGLLGTIRSLFSNADRDTSVTDRIDRMPAVMDLWSERFWFGRGSYTYSPEDYFLLDNQIYETAIEGGMIGLVVLVAFLVAGIWLATAPRRRSSDEATGNLGQAFAAPLAVMLVTMATFDAFSFNIITTLMFLFIGVAGALWRIERHQLTRRAAQNIESRVPEPAG